MIRYFQNMLNNIAAQTFHIIDKENYSKSLVV